MQTTLKKPNWLEIVLLITPFILVLATWDKIPAIVPIHWNIQGKIDGWSTKLFGMLILPFTSILVFLLLWFLPQFDPRIRRSPAEYERTLTILRIVRCAMLLMFLGICCLQVAASLGYPVEMDRWVFNTFLIPFVVLGNYLPNLRPNYFVGIRTASTLKNPETWRATHRIGGHIMVFGGLLMIGIQFFVSKPTFVILYILFILGFTIWAFIYPWNYSRTHAFNN